MACDLGSKVEFEVVEDGVLGVGEAATAVLVLSPCS